jgi:hypothetical protein
MSDILWTNVRVKLGDLKPWSDNPRLSTKAQARRLLTSFEKFGQVQTVAIDPDCNVLDGHQRLSALLTIHGDGYELDARQSSRALTDAERRELVVSLHAGAVGSWDWNAISGWNSEELQLWGMDGDLLKSWNNDANNLKELLQSEQAGGADAANKTLAERFGVPPFSVLDARQGYWQERKRAWTSLGILSEIGRDGNLQGMSESNYEYAYNKKEYLERKGSTLGATPGRGAGLTGSSAFDGSRIKKVRGEDFTGLGANHNGTSIFDPVLCELAYLWFCPSLGQILDPFAGGSVRGIVASFLAYHYIGIDLRHEQIEANEAQAREIVPDCLPVWMEGDSRNVLDNLNTQFDFIFSCPPYFDLEQYSEDEKDLSNASDYQAFLEAYREIIRKAMGKLKDNRFACFVVGDIRDKKGFYRNFPADTIAAFQDAGAILYNEAILVTQVASLPIRIGKQFGSYRKLGKTHQNVLVFYKGDPKAIKSDFGEIEITDIRRLDAGG